MTLKRLVCATVLGLSLLSSPSDVFPSKDKPVSISISIDSGSNFSFNIEDYNYDKKADSVSFINKGERFYFIRPPLNQWDSVKQVQVFDIADRFLSLGTNWNYSGYLNLIKERFPFVKTEIKGKTDLGKFFAGDFVFQKNLEDLIVYSYTRYSRIIKEIKKTKPNQTFQNLLENCNLVDAVRFVFLFSEYNKNLEQFGYRLEKLPSFENDYFEIGFVNLKKGPSFRAEMNMNFDSDTIDAKDIGKFIQDNSRKTMFEYDDRGDYFYGIFRYFQ